MRYFNIAILWQKPKNEKDIFLLWRLKNIATYRYKLLIKYNV